MCELTDALETGQSRLSFHLKVLKAAGLVHDRPEGRWISYVINSDADEGADSHDAGVDQDAEPGGDPEDIRFVLTVSHRTGGANDRPLSVERANAMSRKLPG